MSVFSLRARKVRHHKAAIAGARTRLDGARGEVRELGRLGQPVITRERDAVVDRLMENRRALHHVVPGAVPAVGAIDLDQWVTWWPDVSAPMSEVRVGALRETGGQSLGVPCVVPFVHGRALVVLSRGGRQRDAALALWQAIVTRLVALSAARSEVVLLDPSGSSFRGAGRLFDQVVADGASDALEAWSKETVEHGSRIVAAGNVPEGYSARDAALLMAMVRSGASGSTFVVHVDEDDYRRSIGPLDLGDSDASTNWIVDVGRAELTDPSLTSSVEWDPAPTEVIVDLVADRLGR